MIKETETKLEYARKHHYNAEKTKELLENCLKKFEPEFKHISEKRIQGKRGSSIGEKNYSLQNDLAATYRQTTSDGVKYQFFEMNFGDITQIRSSL